MCGITGFIGQGSEEILKRMATALMHRGPDDAGFFVRGSVGLGQRRLSIIDLSPTGHQPMASSDGNVEIVFNGEIYNFKELRQELQKKGVSFKGTSDTEVIIALYEEYGLDAFKRLNGMFAIALYDFKKNKLILVRDRLGKKPLYWSYHNNLFLFGSELKALTAHPACRPAVDGAALQKYSAYGYLPTPGTIFQNIFKLEPGSYLVYAAGDIQKQQFWDISFSGNTEAALLNTAGDRQGVLKALDSHVAEAVAARLVADVPVGIFLSGGLDSSTVAYYAKRASTSKIKTFSIGFSEKSFNETNYARQVATYLGTEHHEQILPVSAASELLPNLGKIMDEPLADASFIPTFLLSRFTKEKVTVALGGDGGDELFYGYDTFTAEKVYRLLSILPGKGSGLLRAVAGFLPVSHAHFSIKFKLERFLAGVAVSEQYRHHAWMSMSTPREREDLFTSEFRREVANQNVYTDLDRYESLLRGLSRSHELVYLYLKTYLMDQVLVKVDRASMAASLEVRAPFLDYELVDFVNGLDDRFKIKGFKTKYLLKELMKDKLPHEIVFRKKHGFSVPVSDWLTGPLAPFMREVLSESTLKRQGYFNPAYVHRLIEEHVQKKRDHGRILYTLIVWQLWSAANI